MMALGRMAEGGRRMKAVRHQEATDVLRPEAVGVRATK